MTGEISMEQAAKNLFERMQFRVDVYRGLRRTITAEFLGCSLGLHRALAR